MKIEFDPAKNQRNIEERQLSFERAAEFDFETAIYLIDNRRDYKETRWIAAGYLGKRLHMLCFTEIKGGIRVISFRKANQREANAYGKQKTLD